MDNKYPMVSPASNVNAPLTAGAYAANMPIYPNAVAPAYANAPAPVAGAYGKCHRRSSDYVLVLFILLVIILRSHFGGK